MENHLSKSELARRVGSAHPNVCTVLRRGYARPETVAKYRAAVVGETGPVVELVLALLPAPTLADLARAARVRQAVARRAIVSGHATPRVAAALRRAAGAGVGPTAERARNLEARERVSMASLARSLGVSRQSVHQWLATGRVPDAHRAAVARWVERYGADEASP